MKKNIIHLLIISVFASIIILFALSNIFARQVVNDFDGDGKTDFTVIRFSGTGTQYTWYTWGSKDGFSVKYWGYQFSINEGSDSPTVGDYDGDGKWDATVIRGKPSTDPNFYWYILNSSDNSMRVVHWGSSTAFHIQIPQDYDGDGTTDFAVFNNGLWFILRSSDGVFEIDRFGIGGDQPLQGGDYDGDGTDDLAVVRTGAEQVLYVQNSGSGTWLSYQLGNPQFTWVLTGDYDGDGKSDPAVWQGNLWAWLRSSDHKWQGFRFGNPGTDIPIPGDYDGDGKTDVAVVHQIGGQKYFYVQQSRDGQRIVPWGLQLDALPFDRRSIRSTGFRQK